MTDDHIPAWKRIGLKQKASAVKVDPVKDSIKRTAEQSDSSGPKKPPKRAKLPKAERAPPPEPDQLAYLRKFEQDKSNWKFSKQKQNWLLKNLFEIDSKYESALQKYFGEIQGASRDRLVDQAKECVEKWNEFMSKPLEAEVEEASTETKTEVNTEANTEASTKANASKAAKPSKEPKDPKEPRPPTELAARRAQWFVEHLTGSKPELVLLE